MLLKYHVKRFMEKDTIQNGEYRMTRNSIRSNKIQEPNIIIPNGENVSKA